jgi:hypothetical protein
MAHGPAGFTCVIEQAESLSDSAVWTAVATTVLTEAPVSVRVETPSDAAQLYYRAVLPNPTY